MTWAIWLAIPVAVTMLAALWTWVRARPPRQPSTLRAMREHSDYLDALAVSVRHVSAPVAGSPQRSTPET